MARKLLHLHPPTAAKPSQPRRQQPPGAGPHAATTSPPADGDRNTRAPENPQGNVPGRAGMPREQDRERNAGMERQKSTQAQSQRPPGKAQAAQDKRAKSDESCCETSHLEEKAPRQSRKKGNMQIGRTEGDGFGQKGPAERM